MKKKTNRLFRITFLLTLVAALAEPAFADGTETALIVTGTFTGIVVMLIFFVVFVLDGNIEPFVVWLKRMWAYVLARPVESVRQLDEDFDGIAELDNRIPPWFNYLFGATVVFAAYYMVDYHVLHGSPLSGEEYQQEIAAADIAMRVRMAAEGTIDENTLTALTDEASVNAGKERFLKNCISCHGAYAQGIIGPNLTDQYWIHGGGIKNVYATIKNGVPAKGMISWKLVFTPKEIQQIASYVLSLQGSNPLGAKKPEGTLWVEPVAVDTTKLVKK